MHNTPIGLLDKAYAAGLTRHSEPVILEDGTKVRTALYDWDQICGENIEKSVILDNENQCIKLALRALPYESGIDIELATLSEKWKAAITLISQFYDRNKKLFELWIKINGIPEPFFLQYMAEFELLFKELRTYKKLDSYINTLIKVYNNTKALYPL